MFPYNHAIGMQLAHHDPAGDRRMNFVSPPGVVDPSTGLEGETALAVALASGADELSMGFEDGAAAGAGTTDIDTPAGDTVGWTANTPKTNAMLAAASPIDADDWINVHYDETGTIGDLFPSFHLNLVFGAPGGIA